MQPLLLKFRKILEAQPSLKCQVFEHFKNFFFSALDLQTYFNTISVGKLTKFNISVGKSVPFDRLHQDVLSRNQATCQRILRHFRRIGTSRCNDA